MSTKFTQPAIADALCDSGAFRSFVQRGNECLADENAFATALVIEALAPWRQSGEIHEARTRAFSFLLRCQRQGRPGAFAFYPADAHPYWFPENLPADADDTALATYLLYREGIWSLAELQRVAAEVLLPYRLKRARGPTWVRHGAFPTWLDATRLCNPVDICVNINIATLLHVSEQYQSERDCLLGVIDQALTWAGRCRARQSSLWPFYQTSSEVAIAVARAMGAGVPRAESFRNLESCWRSPPVIESPVCCSLDGAVRWFCPLLMQLRRLALMRPLASE